MRSISFFAIALLSVTARADDSTTPSSVAPTSSITASQTPTCFQPRNPADPPASSISNAIASATAAANACSTTIQKVDKSDPLKETIYYQFDSIYFNVSHFTNNVNPYQVSSSFCSDTFNSIVKGCLIEAPSPGYWGGYIVTGGANYSISNLVYPANGLSSSSSTVMASASSSETSIANSITASDSTRLATLSNINAASSTLSGTVSGTSSASGTDSSTGVNVISTGSASSAGSASSSASAPGTDTSSNTVVAPSSPISASSVSSGTTSASVSASDSGSSSNTGSASNTGSTSNTDSMSNTSGVATSLASGTDSASGIPSTSNVNTASSSSPGSGVSYGGASSASNATASPVITSDGSPSSDTVSQGSSAIESASPTPSGITPASSSTSGAAFGTPSLSATPSGMVSPTGSVTGSMTASAITSATVTSTLTDAPPNMSTEHITNTDWSSNTWITTSHDGHSTAVPVLVNCPACGGPGEGIVIWNFPPVPNVSFQFPKFPDLPSFSLPCVKIFGVTVAGQCDTPPANDNDGKPGPPENSQKPSDSPSALISSSQSSNSPSASASNSQSSSSSSSSSSESCAASPTTGALGTRDDGDDDCGAVCPNPLPLPDTDGDLAWPELPTNPGDIEKRAIAGRVVHHIDKRGPAVPVTKINGCNLTPPPGVTVSVPAYPTPLGIWSDDKNGNIPDKYKDIPRYYISTKAGCAATVTKVPASGWTPNQSSKDQNEVVSIEHAYEIGWLQSFMSNIIANNDNPKSLSCADTNKIFFDQETCVDRMSTIFGSLASNTNLEFVLMSQFLNGDAKGRVFGSDYKLPDYLSSTRDVTSAMQWSQAKTILTNKLGGIDILVLASQLINTPELTTLMQKTNNRIYYYFQQIDTFLKDNPTMPGQGFGFATQYQTYMNNYADRFNKVPTTLVDLIKKVGTDLPAAKGKAFSNNNDKELWKGLNLMYQEYKRLYGGATNPIAYEFQWNWNASPEKRDIEAIEELYRRDGSCALPSSSAGSSTGSTSASATLSSDASSTPSSSSESAGSVSSSANLSSTQSSSPASSLAAIPSTPTTTPAPPPPPPKTTSTTTVITPEPGVNWFPTGIPK